MTMAIADLGYSRLSPINLSQLSVNRRIGIHALRTDRALTVLVSLQPISTNYTEDVSRVTNERVV